MDLENYIEGEYRHYFRDISPNNRNKEYDDLYDGINHPKLKALFSSMHSDLVYLFDMMNDRLPTGESVAHYWAEQSRELINTIRTAFSLKERLSGTDYEFSIDPYYNDLLKGCQEWLEESWGSVIPAHMKEVEIYYIKPIFLLNNPMHQNSEFLDLGKQMELLGRGGFGEVYKYHHSYVDMDFAIKVFNPSFLSDDERTESERRFFREARMLFSLNHPNIVKIYDVGRFGDKPFIKMEYIDGQTLDSIRQDHSNFSFIAACKVIVQILEGLKCAHDHGIVHRDLKPNNVMVQKEPDHWTCKIIDFGISAFMDTEGYTRLTRTGEMVAGGLYIDPLLMQNPSLRDYRSDIYSVGAIFYFLLSGRPPAGSNISSVLKKSNQELTEKQVEVVLKALNSELDGRYSNCEEMIAATKKAAFETQGTR